MDTLQSYHMDMLIRLDPQYQNVSPFHFKNVYTKVIKAVNNHRLFSNSLYSPQRDFESMLSRKNKSNSLGMLMFKEPGDHTGSH